MQSYGRAIYGLRLSQGPAGKDGFNGANGLPGINGTNGVDGVNGVDGAPGTNGTPGVQGIQGIQGPAGSNAATDGASVGTYLTVYGVILVGNADPLINTTILVYDNGSIYNNYASGTLLAGTWKSRGFAKIGGDATGYWCALTVQRVA